MTKTSTLHPPAEDPSARGARTIRYALGHCSLGHLLVAATERGVCAVLPGDDPAALRADLGARFPAAKLIESSSALAAQLKRIERHIDDPDPAAAADLALDMHGTAFQQGVWTALRKIPKGKTVSYTDIARNIGAPGSARAVAGACGANAIAVLVPCHRVVRSDGTLSGYRWGTDRKRRLLARERQ